MDQVKLRMIVSLAVWCLVQSVVSVPMVIDGIYDYDTNMPVAITDDIFDLKDKTDIFDPSLMLNRFRRNTAQWLSGSHHFNDYDHEGSSRRWAHRRFNTRNQGGGQIVNA